MTTTTVTLSPVANLPQFFNNLGVPLAGGLIYTYVAGSSTTLATTYTTGDGSVPNSNPIVLDSSGRLNTEIWLATNTYYRIVVTDATSVVLTSWDSIVGYGSSVSNSTITIETVTATTQGQTTITLVNPYAVGANVLEISVNGAVLVVGVDYYEAGSNSITMAVGLNLGDVICSRVFSVQAGTYTSAALVSDSGHTTVQNALNAFRLVTTVAGLGSAVTAGVGVRAFVTDATSTTFATAAVGGGVNKMPVFSNGTIWLVG